MLEPGAGGTGGPASTRNSLVVLCALVSSLSCSGTATEPASTLQPEIVGDGFRASVSGHFVAWAPFTEIGSPLYVLNLDSGERWPLIEAGSRTEPNRPSIDGTWVAWMSYRQDSMAGSVTSIQLANIRGDSVFSLASLPTFGEERIAFPRVSGDRVLWEKFIDAPREVQIVVYSIDLDQRIVIADSIQTHYPAAMSGDRIIFTRQRTDSLGPSADDEVVLYDLLSGSMRRLNRMDGREVGDPDISGNVAVWEACSQQCDIMYRDLETGEVLNVTRGRGQGIRPRVAGSRIVWQDRRDGDDDVYMYQIDTGWTVKLTDNPGDQVYPVVSSERWVVWGDQGAPRWEVMAVRTPD